MVGGSVGGDGNLVADARASSAQCRQMHRHMMTASLFFRQFSSMVDGQAEDDAHDVEGSKTYSVALPPRVGGGTLLYLFTFAGQALGTRFARTWASSLSIDAGGAAVPGFPLCRGHLLGTRAHHNATVIRSPYLAPMAFYIRPCLRRLQYSSSIFINGSQPVGLTGAPVPEP